jgi:hypothetical protein
MYPLLSEVRPITFSLMAALHRNDPLAVAVD